MNENFTNLRQGPFFPPREEGSGGGEGKQKQRVRQKVFRKIFSFLAFFFFLLIRYVTRSVRIQKQTFCLPGNYFAFFFVVETTKRCVFLFISSNNYFFTKSCFSLVFFFSREIPFSRLFAQLISFFFFPIVLSPKSVPSCFLLSKKKKKVLKMFEVAGSYFYWINAAATRHRI